MQDKCAWAMCLVDIRLVDWCDDLPEGPKLLKEGDTACRVDAWCLLLSCLRCIATTAFHFNATFEDSEGGCCALTAIIQLLNQAASLSDTAKFFFLEVCPSANW